MKQTIYLICTTGGVRRMRIVNGVRRMGLGVGEIAIKVNVNIDDKVFSKEIPEIELKLK